jgi:uncharacterized membrane protein
MKTITEFFKTTVVGGLVVILPLMILYLIFGELVELLVQLTGPITKELPFSDLINVIIASLIAIAVALIFCFLTGLIVRTGWGGATKDWVEKKFLSRLPIYSMIKNLSHRFVGQSGEQFAPAEVDLYGSDSRLLGFIVEVLPDERVAVFIPFAPTATVGQVHILPQERIKKLDATLGSVVNSVTQWGVGTRGVYQR